MEQVEKSNLSLYVSAVAVFPACKGARYCAGMSLHQLKTTLMVSWTNLFIFIKHKHTFILTFIGNMFTYLVILWQYLTDKATAVTLHGSSLPPSFLTATADEALMLHAD